jgi:hypothetical protein
MYAELGGCLDVGRGVVKEDEFVRRHLQSVAQHRVDLGIRLGQADLVRVEDHVEQLPEAIPGLFLAACSVSRVAEQPCTALGPQAAGISHRRCHSWWLPSALTSTSVRPLQARSGAKLHSAVSFRKLAAWLKVSPIRRSASWVR